MSAVTGLLTATVTTGRRCIGLRCSHIREQKVEEVHQNKMENFHMRSHAQEGWISKACGPDQKAVLCGA